MGDGQIVGMVTSTPSGSWSRYTRIEFVASARPKPLAGEDRLCPFIAAAVEIPDPGHPARVYARDYKLAFAARLTEAAREAGATDPEQLGEQLALLLDGASARSRVLNTETLATAAAIAAVLVDNAILAAA
jgi:hypothetical protein